MTHYVINNPKVSDAFWHLVAYVVQGNKPVEFFGGLRYERGDVSYLETNDGDGTLIVGDGDEAALIVMMERYQKVSANNLILPVYGIRVGSVEELIRQADNHRLG